MKAPCPRCSVDAERYETKSHKGKNFWYSYYYRCRNIHCKTKMFYLESDKFTIPKQGKKAKVIPYAKHKLLSPERVLYEAQIEEIEQTLDHVLSLTDKLNERIKYLEDEKKSNTKRG